MTDEEIAETYGCTSIPCPWPHTEPDACGHGDNPDETCEGCYG